MAETEVQRETKLIESEWADIFYKLPENQQAGKLEPFIPRLEALQKKDPKAAEPLIMEALVYCSLAATDLGFSALGRVAKARDLLLQSVPLNPRAMDASAYVTLGNLYHRVPPWPISYGDDEIAKHYLEMALMLYPNAVDTNYFYGDFLLDDGEYEKALPYLEKAEKAPVRSYAYLSDLQLKKELVQALKDAREQNDDRANFFTRFIYNSDEP
jgi:tetratricopeptide (TPR) repeat protein